MRCCLCGSEFRITLINNEPYCFRCEADASLEAFGVIRRIRKEAS